jgi:hypothetical protein
MTMALPTRKPGQPADPAWAGTAGCLSARRGRLRPPRGASDGLLGEGKGYRPLVIDLSVE